MNLKAKGFYLDNADQLKALENQELKERKKLFG
jgi:hypothetical protein